MMTSSPSEKHVILFPGSKKAKPEANPNRNIILDIPPHFPNQALNHPSSLMSQHLKQSEQRKDTIQRVPPSRQ